MCYNKLPLSLVFLNFRTPVKIDSKCEARGLSIAEVLLESQRIGRSGNCNDRFKTIEIDEPERSLTRRSRGLPHG